MGLRVSPSLFIPHTLRAYHPTALPVLPQLPTLPPTLPDRASLLLPGTVGAEVALVEVALGEAALVEVGTVLTSTGRTVRWLSRHS